MGYFTWLFKFTGLIFCALTLCTQMSYAQELSANLDSEAAKRHYQHYFRTDTRLLSGDFYQTPLMNKATGHPFFSDANWKNGSVVINGVLFDELQLRYDVSSHQVILNSTEQTDSYIQVSLKKKNIQSFTLDNHTFIPHNVADIKYGIRFVQKRVEGQVEFLILRSKSLKVSSGGSSDFRYQDNEHRYLLYQNEWISYRGKKTLIKTFPGFKNEIKTFIKLHKLRFKHLTNNDHARIIDHVNSLIQDRS